MAKSPSADGPSLRPAVTVVPLLVVTTVISCVLAYLQKRPCQNAGFDLRRSFSESCYTDVYPLYYNRGLSDGKVPYLDKIAEPVEYPVLTGWFMHAVARLAQVINGDRQEAGMTFYNLTALFLAALAIGAVILTAYAAGRNNLLAGLMIAASPGLIFAAYMNWDLLAVALTAGSVALWARRWREGGDLVFGTFSAGMLLGAAVSAKFYPLVLLGAFLLLCLRAGKLREFGIFLGGAAAAWLAINAPVMVLAWDGWKRFYGFSQERPVDWGSVFYYFSQKETPVLGDPELLNRLGTGLFLVLCAAIGALVLMAPQRPRLPQVLFLVLAAFMLTNKVWSPQYVLWLLPLVALARPRLPAFIVWQIGEIIYFFGIWFYLLALGVMEEMGPDLPVYPVHFFHTDLNVSSGEVNSWYWFALFARFLTVLMLMVLVVVDILMPRRDSVRRDGADDPAGGILDRAPDRFVLRRRPVLVR